jgi:hypothetical protein
VDPNEGQGSSGSAWSDCPISFQDASSEEECRRQPQCRGTYKKLTEDCVTSSTDTHTNTEALFPVTAIAWVEGSRCDGSVDVVADVSTACVVCTMLCVAQLRWDGMDGGVNRCRSNKLTERRPGTRQQTTITMQCNARRKQELESQQLSDDELIARP